LDRSEFHLVIVTTLKRQQPIDGWTLIESPKEKNKAKQASSHVKKYHRVTK
jgi:hypothetical protein